MQVCRLLLPPVTESRVSPSFRRPFLLPTDCIKEAAWRVLFSRLEKVPNCHLRDCLTSNRARSVICETEHF